VLIRAAARVLPGLQAYPFALPGAGTIQLDFRDNSSCAMVNFAMGELGPNEFLFDLMQRCLQPRDVLWDVGANLGWVCAHFAQPRYGLSSIQAFEPNPAALNPLRSLFDHHPLVTVHPFGLGQEESIAEMNVLAGSTQVGSLKQSFPGEQRVPVQIRRGDDVQRELQLPLPNVVKIDVEGFEPMVIAGMAQIIARARPVIFFEYQFLTDEEIRALNPAGYEILLMLDDGRLTADFSKRVLGHDAVLFPAGERRLFEKDRRENEPRF
jgi:FkbM family methyltransferase